MNIQGAFNSMLGQIGTIKKLGEIADNTKANEEAKAASALEKADAAAFRKQTRANNLALQNEQLVQAKALSNEIKKARRSGDRVAIERLLEISQNRYNQSQALQERKQKINKKVKPNG